MAVYIVTGKLGSGKTLVTVGKIRDYLAKGKRVATNLDIYPEKMLPKNTKEMSLTRLPDKPRLADLQNLGTGSGNSIDQYNENEFGLMVLDELGTWFNTRTWSDKERADLIDWFLHARKYHWDLYLIVQDINVIDKQLRDSLAEHLVVCRRMDRLKVPLIGSLFGLVGIKLKPPKVHIGTVFYGQNEQGFKVDRWWYRGTDLYPAYRTGQVFKLDHTYDQEGNTIDMRAPYSVLSPWHLVGRYKQKPGFNWLALPVIILVYLLTLLWATFRGRSPREVAHGWGLLKETQEEKLNRLQLASEGSIRPVA